MAFLQKISLILFILSINIQAHQLRENYLSVDYNSTAQTLKIILEVETRLLENYHLLDENKNGIISFNELSANQEYLFSYVQKHFKLSYNTQKLSLSDAKIIFHRYQDQTYMQVFKAFDAVKLDGLILEYDMFFELESIHKLLIHSNENQGDFILDNTTRMYPFSSLNISQMQRFFLFLQEGMSHILDGWDHLLFILMLLLPSTVLFNHSNNHHEFKRIFYSLLKIITAFSIAHSLTLFISGMGLWMPNITVIESSIALSILVVGLLNLFGKYRHIDYKIVLFFGLLHGFGFANVLEIAHINNTSSFLVALFGFNAGVEVGQILVILLVIPIFYFSRNAKYYFSAIKIISFMAVSVSLFWFLQRVDVI
ncbi:HupE/UreJ family protein [bacterium]|nr:HupE/UreJ family protein [bacterium]MBU1994672.1 HupE/UreJ family protein [bacterium]